MNLPCVEFLISCVWFKDMSVRVSSVLSNELNFIVRLLGGYAIAMIFEFFHTYAPQRFMMTL